MSFAPASRWLGLALAGAGGLAACGAAAPHQASPTPEQAAAAPIVVSRPATGVRLAARSIDKRRLSAAIVLAGTAQPGQQLEIRGACGKVSCESLTFSNAKGRWQTRMALTTPRGSASVALRVRYSSPELAAAPVEQRILFRKARAETQAVDQLVPASAEQDPSPPSSDDASGGTPAPGSDAGPHAGTHTLLMIGDSLAVGTAAPLRAELPGWDVRTDGRISRPLGEGMEILAATELPPGEQGRHTVLAFSLFTNDSPAIAGQLELAVRTSVSRLGPGGCAIWATISRPPFAGMTYRAVNARLRALAAAPELAGRLIVVPWAERVADHPSWKASDHVHATPAGYAARARMYADAARRCAA